MQAYVIYEIDKSEAIKQGKTEWGKFKFFFVPSELPEDVRGEAAGLVHRLDDAIRCNSNRDGEPSAAFSGYILNEKSNASYEVDYASKIKILDTIDLLRFVEILRSRISIRKEHEDIMAEKARQKKEEEKEKEILSRIEKTETARKKLANGGCKELAENYRKTGVFDPFFGCYGGHGKDVLPDWVPADLRAAYDIAWAEREQKEKQEREEKEKKQREKEAQEERQKAFRKTLIIDAISVHGDIADFQRYEAGMMSESEQSSFVARYVFSSDFEPFKKLKKSSLPHDCGLNDEVSFFMRNAETCTRDEWLALNTIKKGHPGKRIGEIDVAYNAMLAERVITCSRCEKEISFICVKVDALAGGLVVATRIFEIPPKA